jgi:hypothetical protein
VILADEEDTLDGEYADKIPDLVLAEPDISRVHLL